MQHLRVVLSLLGHCLALLLALAGFAFAQELQSKPASPRVRLEKVFNVPGPTALAWSPDGKLLVISNELDRRITFFDYASQKALHTIDRNVFGFWWLVFTPDGRHLITSTVQAQPPNRMNRIAFSIIDVETGQVVRDVEGPEEYPQHVARNIARKFALSPPTRRAAIITRDDKGEFVSFYDADNWSLLSTHRLAGTEKALFLVSSMASNPMTGEVVLLAVGGQLETWSPPEERPLRRLQAHVNSGRSLAFTARGHVAATAEGPLLGSETPDPSAIKL